MFDSKDGRRDVSLTRVHYGVAYPMFWVWSPPLELYRVTPAPLHIGRCDHARDHTHTQGLPPNQCSTTFQESQQTFAVSIRSRMTRLLDAV